jgi:aminoglycoside 2''-phosphotransferase
VELRQGRVDLEALIAKIRTAFPGFAFAGAALNDLGEDHAVAIVDEAWVFRFPRTAEAAALGAGERRLLDSLRQVSPVPTPRYELVSAAGDVAGYPMIPGAPLSEPLFASLPRAIQAGLLETLGVFLAHLHRLPPGLLTPPRGIATAWRGEDYSRRYRLRRARLASTLPRAVLLRLDRFFEQLPGVVDKAPSALIHGDLSEDHILLAPDGDRLGGVIDFTDAGLGDPAFDFTFLWTYGDWAPAQAARGYDAVEETQMLARSRWWFIRYSVDQIWGNLRGARDCDIAKVEHDIRTSLDALGL